MTWCFENKTKFSRKDRTRSLLEKNLLLFSRFPPPKIDFKRKWKNLCSPAYIQIPKVTQENMEISPTIIRPCFLVSKTAWVSYLGSLLVTIRQKRTKMIQTFVCNLETTIAWVNNTRNINKGFSVFTVPYRTFVLNWQRFLTFFLLLFRKRNYSKYVIRKLYFFYCPFQYYDTT